LRRVAGVFRPKLQISIVVVDLPEDLLAVVLERSKVVFAVGIVVGCKSVKRFYLLLDGDRRHEVESHDSCRQHDTAAFERPSKLVVELADLTRLVFRHENLRLAVRPKHHCRGR